MNTPSLKLGHWQAHPGKLAQREAEAVLQVANGATNKIGARAMGISPVTFGKTLARAMYKLHTHTRAETVAEGIRQGIVRAMLIMLTLQCCLGVDDGLRTSTRPMRLVTNIKIVRAPGRKFA